MKKELSAGTNDEQRTAADSIPSASVEASPMLAGVRAIKERFQDWQLSNRLVQRLRSMEKEKWIYISHTFNSWEFPVEFYDLIPKWWNQPVHYKRKCKVINPLMTIVDKHFTRKEQLRYHNVFRGKMSNDEFEYWFYLDTNGLDITEYYERKWKIEGLRWWQDDVFEKLTDAKVW